MNETSVSENDNQVKSATNQSKALNKTFRSILDIEKVLKLNIEEKS